MNKEIIFNVNNVDLEDIYSYLLERDDEFTPPLSEKLDILEFANKMHKNANIYTVHERNEIIGLVGCYANNFETLEAYITNFSIHPNYYSTGLAKDLIHYCIKDVSDNGFKAIKLEVHMDNERAIHFYKKIGFKITEGDSNPTSIYMLKTLYPTLSKE